MCPRTPRSRGGCKPGALPSHGEPLATSSSMPCPDKVLYALSCLDCVVLYLTLTAPTSLEEALGFSRACRHATFVSFILLDTKRARIAFGPWHADTQHGTRALGRGGSPSCLRLLPCQTARAASSQLAMWPPVRHLARDLQNMESGHV